MLEYVFEHMLFCIVVIIMVGLVLATNGGLDD